MQNEQDRWISFDELVEMGVVKNRTTLSRWVRDLEFPAGTMLGPNTRRWREKADIGAWIERRKAAAQ